MRDLYPSMPSREYRTSRRLRLYAFALVVSTVLVSMLIVLIQFLWDQVIRRWLNRAPYEPRVEFIVPAILLIAWLMSRLLWDAAQGRAASRGSNG